MRAKCDLCGRKRECVIDSDGDRVCLGCEKEMGSFMGGASPFGFPEEAGPLPVGVSAMTPEQQTEWDRNHGIGNRVVNYPAPTRGFKVYICECFQSNYEITPDKISCPVCKKESLIPS